MPLIIHAASQCDICFSTYAWDQPEQAPHVIPCGHTFCKECLTNITSITNRPPTCPLCRKGFKRDPVKLRRLHANGPPADELKHNDLLERLVLAWKLTDPDPELRAEIQQFLDGKDENQYRSLRSALEGTDTLRKLRFKYEKTKILMRTATQKVRANHTEDERNKEFEALLMRRYRDEVDHLHQQLAMVNSFFDDGPTKGKGKGKQRPNPLPTPPQDIFRLPEYQILNTQPSLPANAGTSNTQVYTSVLSKLSQAIQQAQSQYDPALGRQNVIVGGAQPESRVTIPPEQESHEGPNFQGAGRLIGYLRGDDGSFHHGYFNEQSQAGPSKHPNVLQTTESTTSLSSMSFGASSSLRPHQRSNTFPHVSFDTSNSSQPSTENSVPRTHPHTSVANSRAGGRTTTSQLVTGSTRSGSSIAEPSEQPQLSQGASQQHNARAHGTTARRRNFNTGMRVLLEEHPAPLAPDNISIVSWGTSAHSDGSSLRSMNLLSSFFAGSPGAPGSYVVPVGDPSAFLPLRNPVREEEGGVLSPLDVEWIPQTRPAPRGRHRRLSSAPNLPSASRATVRPTSEEGLGRRGLVDETEEEHDNALGLVDLRRREDSPFIAQPTPMVPAAHFLRSFSHQGA
ncbi:uncharacterized protein BT62DRAFT_571449 [Guyanagaster necrorhizus]|uniref:RING-type domain-containing protein n=1 Tax=Guyanagaster necrorhizus TaxID=856835 RepID=A0A9P7VGU6_9AGAR|nr:uncharacterized protein BT62DRAFT_571449 [Guyanagaster necrorhizus MCA 3950]KAG7440761.1 hypothetical protein BT62DRAFT_571449 [Guyanagaster necrorhizus MCA 3950]